MLRYPSFELLEVVVEGRVYDVQLVVVFRKPLAGHETGKVLEQRHYILEKIAKTARIDLLKLK